MAAEDEGAVRSHLVQRVWQGSLPARIVLAANESKSFTNTLPLYVLPANRSPLTTVL